MKRTILAALAALAAVLGITLATVPGGAAPAHGTTAIPATLNRCTIKYTAAVFDNPNYAVMWVTQDAGCLTYYVKALCKLTPTIGKTVYGLAYRYPGKSRANCPSGYRVSAAWAHIGTTNYQFYP